jgi:tetratricopeptide (TPR) repeat protein
MCFKILDYLIALSVLLFSANALAQSNDSLFFWNSHAVDLYKQGELQQAIEFLESKEHIYSASRKSNQHDVILFYQIKAQAANRLGQHEKSMKLSTEAMKFIEDENLFEQNFEQYIYFIDFMSYNSSVTHDYFRALSYVQKGIEFNEKYGKDAITLISYLNMAGII